MVGRSYLAKSWIKFTVDLNEVVEVACESADTCSEPLGTGVFVVCPAAVPPGPAVEVFTRPGRGEENVFEDKREDIAFTHALYHALVSE